MNYVIYFVHNLSINSEQKIFFEQMSIKMRWKYNVPLLLSTRKFTRNRMFVCGVLLCLLMTIIFLTINIRMIFICKDNYSQFIEQELNNLFHSNLTNWNTAGLYVHIWDDYGQLIHYTTRTSKVSRYHGSVSFSFIHSALKVVHNTQGGLFGKLGAGIIFNLKDYKNNDFWSPLCWYPRNGLSLVKEDCGCGTVAHKSKSIWSNDNIPFSRCPVNNNTYYSNLSGIAYEHNVYRNVGKTSLSYDAFIVAESQQTDYTSRQWNHNEVLIRSWDESMLVQLPLFAFIITNFQVLYLTVRAKNDYFMLTGIYKPIFFYNVTNISFSFIM